MKKKRIISLALAAALILALGVAAYASNWFGLSSRLTPAENPYSPYKEPEQDTVPAGGWVAPNGYTDSEEAQASIEWTNAREEMLDQTDYDSVQVNEWFAAQETDEAIIYTCYDQKMLDRLLEIRDKYGLSLHTESATPMTHELFYQATGMEDFLRTDKAHWICQYIYEDGSFKLEGAAENMLFSMQRSLSGTLAPYIMYVSQPEEYDEWQFESDGHLLNLAVKANSGIIFLQEGEQYITISFSLRDDEKTTPMLKRSDAEHFANLFDYGILCGAEANLSVINGLTAREAQPKDGLFTFSDYLQTPEYVAGSTFQKAFGDWNDSKGQYMEFHYAPFPTGVDVLDELLASFQEQYGLKMPTEAKFIMVEDWIDAERVTSPISYNREPGEEVSLGKATEKDFWTLMGTENFLRSPESYPFSLGKWNNGAWQAEIVYGSGAFELTYVPKGSFCPVLKESLHPDSAGWAYETACGEQVYICLDGEMVYPRFPVPVALYETDTAYVVLTVSSNTDAAQMQMFADVIDFTKLG